MDTSYWQKQTKDEPLFPNMLWNRPENRMHAGKLLIIGGNSSGFKAPADAYRYAVKAGIGTARILLPDSLRKTVGEVFLEMGEYAPSTPSGSFSYRSFAELLAHSNWADGVLLAGDFGRNSETAQLLEYFVNKYTGQLTITGDALDYFLGSPSPIIQRPNTVLVVTFQQLQKIARALKSPHAITSSMSLSNFAHTLLQFTNGFQAGVLVQHLQQYCVVAESHVSTTPFLAEPEDTLLRASNACVWWLQNPTQQFSALTTSII